MLSKKRPFRQDKVVRRDLRKRHVNSHEGRGGGPPPPTCCVSKGASGSPRISNGPNFKGLEAFGFDLGLDFVRSGGSH